MTAGSMIFVVGPHRSGTSVATRLAEVAGASLLADSLLYRGGVANPAGFFEYQSFTRVNDHAFRRLGAHWSAPPQPAETRTRSARELFGRTALLRVPQRFAAAREGTVLWKDPRLCVLMRRWMEELRPGKTSAILVIRSPSEVALSLQTRNGFDTELGLAIWSAYMLAALENLADIATYLVNFDRLQRSPESYVEGLRAAMKQAELPRHTRYDQTAEREARSFVKASLYRSRAEPRLKADSEIARLTQALFSDLASLEMSQGSRFQRISPTSTVNLTDMTWPRISERRAQLAERIQSSLRFERRAIATMRFLAYASASWVRSRFSVSGIDEGRNDVRS
jgi:hypothetical protein